jgi:hypothetical protein
MKARNDHRTARSAVIAAGLLLGLACSGGGGSDDQGGHGSIAGVVVMAGPGGARGGGVAGANVTITQHLQDGASGATFQTTTGPDGSFGPVDVGVANYAFEVEATGGTTTDLVTGNTLSLDPASSLHSVQLAFELDEQRGASGGTAPAIVSPFTEIAYRLATARLAAHEDSDYGSAHQRAIADLSKHFLGVDDLTRGTIAGLLDAPQASVTSDVKHAVALASLSYLAHSIAADSGLSPQQVNAKTVMDAWIADLTSSPDLLWNGQGNGGAPVTVGQCKQHLALCIVNEGQLRLVYAQQVAAYLHDASNQSGAAWKDLGPAIQATAGDTNADLFPAGTPPAFTTDPPTVAWTAPDDAAKVTGAITIDASAGAVTAIASLTVEVVNGPTLANEDTTNPAHFHVGAWSSAVVSDGPQTLRATATDALGQTTTSERTIVVANAPPGLAKGVVVFGPYAGATVTIYELQNGTRGPVFGTGTTASDGSFDVQLGTGYSGDLLVEVTGPGTYTEEARPGTQDVVVTTDLTSVLDTVYVGYNGSTGGVSSIVVTPVTTWAYTLAGYLHGRPDYATKTYGQAWNDAVGAIQGLIGVANITSLPPTSPSQITTLNAASKYTLVLIGISQRALQLSGQGVGTFGAVSNSNLYISKLAADLADGCADGHASGVQLYYGGTVAVDDQAVRRELADAIAAYLGSSANQTPFSSAVDVLSVLDALSSGGVGTGSGSCTSGGIFNDDGSGFDQTPPTIAWLGMTPADGAYVRGSIQLQATATDDVSAARAWWSMPAGLPDDDGDTTNANVFGHIDTTQPGDGPLVVEASAVDQSNNLATAQRHYTVDNTAPVITVSGVSDGDTYADNRVISFGQTDKNPGTTTATLNGASIVSGAQVTADGDYTLLVNATDKAGNPAAPVTLTFHLNRSAPVITVTGVTDGQYYNTNRTITYSHNGTGGTISATLDGAAFASGTTVSAEGSYTLVVDATSASGVPSSTTVHFVVDKTVPAITVTGVSSGGAYNQNVFVSFSQSDANPGTTTATLNGAAITTGYAVVSDGDYSLQVNATDLAGNAAPTVNLTFTVDKTPPVINLSGVANGAYYNTSRTITFSQSDAHPATLTATLNGAAFTSGGTVSTEGSYTLVINAKDTAGNTAVFTVQFVIDKTPPTINVTGVSGGGVYNDNRAIVFSQTDANPGTTTATLNNNPISSGTSATADGEYDLQVSATDLAGNAATPVLIHFAIDRAPPTISINGVTSGAYYNATRTITFTTTDAHPGTVSATLDGGAFASGGVASAEGSHVLTVKATDAAGNTAAVTVQFVIDKTPPTITVGGVTAGAVYKDNRSITFSQTDANPGTTSATLDGGPISSGYLVTSDGEYDLQVNATDLAGNAAPPVLIHFALDRTPPTINVSGVADGGFYNAAKTITYSESDAHSGTVSATLNGAAFASGGSVSAEGTYTLHVSAGDGAGNTSTRDVSFVIDATKPVVTISGVADGTWYPAAVTPVVMVTDTYLQSQSVTLDGVAFTSGTQVSAQGAHTLVASGTDKAGNTASRTVSFTIDSAAPTIAWDPSTPADGSYQKTAFHVIATAADNLQLTAFAMTQPSGQVDVDATLGRLDVVLDPSVLGDQTLAVTLQAQDRAGNATPATRTFVIDRTAPTLSVAPTGFVTVAGTFWTGAAATNLTGSASDAHFLNVTVTDTTSGKSCGTSTSASWSVSLSSCLVEGANALAITASDAAGNSTTINQSVGLDTTSPTVTLSASAVVDESKDTVQTFSGTTPIAPVHTHSTSPSDIPAIDRSTCASPVDLSLYGYLHDQDAPIYGTQTKPNPFVWTFTPADGGAGIDPAAGATQYRVSLHGGAVLVDWTNATPNGDGSFSVALYRKLTGGVTTSPAIPSLGTADATFQIDLQSKDRLGHAWTETRCWKHHPLAAPLSVRAAATASTTVAGTAKVALSSFALSAAGATVPSIPAYILNDGSPGTGLTEFKITNMTAEPVYVTLALAPPTTNPTYSQSSQLSYVETSYTDWSSNPANALGCPSSSTGECARAVPTSTAPLSGTLSPSYTQRVFDTTAGGAVAQSPCAGCTNTALTAQYLVDKATSSAGHPYVVQSAIKTIPELRPSGGTAPFSDVALTYYASKTATTTTTSWITGQTYATTVTACDRAGVYTPPGGTSGWVCLRQGTYQQYRAVSQMSIAFAAPQFVTQVSSGPTSSSAPTPHLIATTSGLVASPALNTSQTLPPAP